MNTNVSLIASLRRPFRSFLFLILFGLISSGFVTKAVGAILVQRETGVLGSYYRSIGVLENREDPQSGDVSAGIELIETSPYFAYGDLRQVVSGVMPQTYNANDAFKWSNASIFTQNFPEEHWQNVHTTDVWFTGVMIKKEEAQVEEQDGQKKTLGNLLNFQIETVFAAYPENAQQGQTIGLLFMFEGNEGSIPFIQQMETGQRYLIRGWEDYGQEFFPWNSPYNARYQIKPLDDQQLWYLPIAKEALLDFSDPELATIKNKIDILNENLSTLNIIATADLSASPKTQESARYYYLTAGRWLNYQDTLEKNKVIVVREDFATTRGFEPGDDIQLTFRPLKDTFLGYIRDGVDSQNWRSYPTYNDTFTIVGIYARTTAPPIYAYIPSSSLMPGFGSGTREQFRYELDYSFVLHSARYETEFLQAYKDPLEELGISLTFLPNNGPAYWAAVDPIRHSTSADLLVFSLLLVVVLILAVFLYVRQQKRGYAILRVLGVPAKQANRQTIWPLLLVGGPGIILGGVSSWKYAIDQAQISLSTLPTPAGAAPSADLSPFILASLSAAMILLLAFFTWLGVFLLSRIPIFELLQGETAQNPRQQMQPNSTAASEIVPAITRSPTGRLAHDESSRPGHPASKAHPAGRRKYTPSSLGLYVLHRSLRSRLKSTLTVAVALGFVLAAGWIQQTIARSRVEVDRLYETTVIEADILRSSSAASAGGRDYISRDTIDRVSNSGFVSTSVLEATSTWTKIERLYGSFPIYAYDSPETFYAGITDPDALVFASGWDIHRFVQPRTLAGIREEGIPALFPAILLEQWGIAAGETIQIADRSNRPYTCIIVGQYSSWKGSPLVSPQGHTVSIPILIPLSTLEVMDDDHTQYTLAHFVLDPEKNRELPQLRGEMEDALKVYAGKFRFVIWDEELRIVIAQLEQNLSLLRVFYPVVIAVSVLIGAGLCFLLLLQATREAAILRVLGITKAVVQMALLVEPLILSMTGVIFGLGIAYFLWRTSGLIPAGTLLISAGLYLAGVLAGSVSGAISVSSKKPIELLQVKE
jgi:hypothetical protein